MKKLMFSVLAILIIGCEEPNVSVKPTLYRLPRGKNKSGSLELKIVEIEGCEYFMCTNFEGNVLSHKGNCKNPIHYKK